MVFHLHNFGYSDRSAFAHATAVLFPSEYSRRDHLRRLGIDGPAIHYRVRLDRVIAEDREPRYITFCVSSFSTALPRGRVRGRIDSKVAPVATMHGAAHVGASARPTDSMGIGSQRWPCLSAMTKRPGSTCRQPGPSSSGSEATSKAPCQRSWPST